MHRHVDGNGATFACFGIPGPDVASVISNGRWNISLEYLGEFRGDYTGNGVFGSLGFAF